MHTAWNIRLWCSKCKLKWIFSRVNFGFRQFILNVCVCGSFWFKKLVSDRTKPLLLWVSVCVSVHARLCVCLDILHLCIRRVHTQWRKLVQVNNSKCVKNMPDSNSNIHAFRPKSMAQHTKLYVPYNLSAIIFPATTFIFLLISFLLNA